MMDKKSDTRASQRHKSAAVPPTFKIAVVRKKLVSANEHEFCDLLDIGHGGIGIASQWLTAKIGQKLHLELHHGRKKYAARGLVTRVSTHGKFEHYGIAFIYAPPELDLLIKLFGQEPSPPAAATVFKPKEVQQRYGGTRVAIPDAQVYAKTATGEDSYLLCQVDNISHSGMGFYADSKLDKAVPFAISVRISMAPDAMEITGTVHHVRKKANAYYYGMEYEQLPKEFFQLLKTLA
jgi:hypothetical protein